MPLAPSPSLNHASSAPAMHTEHCVAPKKSQTTPLGLCDYKWHGAAGMQTLNAVPWYTPYSDKATDSHYVLCDQVAARNVMLSQVFLTPFVKQGMKLKGAKACKNMRWGKCTTG